MFELDAIPLGISLFLAGLAFFLLTILIARLIARKLPNVGVTTTLPVMPELTQHNYAVLMIQPGGRVLYMNRKAREIFDTWDEGPNIERLARRTRPVEAFLSLAATDGQASLSIGGQMMDGTSFIVPNGSSNTVLLTVRPQNVSVLGAKETEYSDQTLEVLASLSRSMASDLELETTLQSILTSIEQLVPTDFAEITVWDAENAHLIPYRFIGVTGVDRRIEMTDDRYPLGQGYSGYIAAHRKPIIIPDVDTHREFRPLIDRRKYPFQSYLGMPLLVSGEFVGALGLTSLDKDAFTEGDLEILRLLSGQAAIALHNALLFREEKRRALELSSLANLTQAMSAVQNSSELFARLAQGISPLLDVEIAGFMLYEDAQRRLVAQKPFIGVPSQFVEWYMVEIPADSPADRIWREQTLINAANAAEDHRIIDLGLDHSCRAAGIKHTVLVPLKSGGRTLGYLQAANKRDGTPFSQDDIRLLSIIAGQAAPVVENASLVQQSIQRALRAEALRRIASLSGSEADLDEILKYSVLELSRLLKVDAAAVFFLDENVGELQAHLPSIYGVSGEPTEALGRIPVDDNFAKYIVSNSQQTFISDDTIEDPRIIPPYRQLIDTLNVRSAIDVPLVFRGQGMGEMMLASHRPEHFSRSDIQLAMTVAGQLAVAVERASLATQTDADLRQRVEQLTAISRIGRELSVGVSPNRLLEQIYQEALQAAQADCGTILLFNVDEAEETISQVGFSVGDPPAKELHPLEKVVLERGASILVGDFQQPPETLDEATVRPAHSGVRSALVVPIAHQGRVAGLIHLHSKRSGHFDENAVQIVQVLAVQAAIAIINARRYQDQTERNQQLHRRLKSLKTIFETAEGIHQSAALEKPLREMALGLHEVSGYPAVVIGVCDSQDRLNWLAGAGVSPEWLQLLRGVALTWVEVENVLKSDHLLLSSYLIPPGAPGEAPEWLNLLMDVGRDAAPRGSVLLLPLSNASAEALGVIAVGGLPPDEYPDRLSLEILGDFARQSAQFIANHQWANQLDLQVKSLQSQLSESRSSAVKILGQRLLSQSEQRVNAVLEIVELLARQPDRVSVLEKLGQSLLSKLGLHAVLIVEQGAGGPQLLHARGDIPRRTSLEALLGQRNPLTQSINEGITYLVANLDEHGEWHQSPLLQALNAKGFLCLSVFAHAGAPIAVLAVSAVTLPAFSGDDEQLFSLLARQTATALNNLTLLTETSQRLREVYLLLEFSRQLGSLEPERVLRLLVESALEIVQPAQACAAVMFDASAGVLAPQAALGYTDNDVLSKIDFLSGDTLIRQVFETGEIARVKEVDFTQHYNLEQAHLLRYREAIGERLPVSSIMVPIQAGTEMLGVLALDNYDGVDAFSIDDQVLISSLTRQSALTLENIRLYQAAEQRALHLQALSGVSATISANLELDVLVNVLLETLKDLVPYDTGTLWLREDDTLTIKSAQGFGEHDDLIGLSTQVDDSQLFTEMIQENRPIFVADVRDDARFSNMPAERLSWLAVPMFAKGEVVGVLVLEKAERDFYSPDHIQILSTFANQAAVAMENADLYRQSLERTAELDRRSQRLAMINRFANQIGNTLDLDYLLHVTSQELAQALPCSKVAAIIKEDQAFVIRCESPQQGGAHLPKPLPDAPIIAHLQQSLGVFSTTEVHTEALLEPWRAYFVQNETRALLVLPLVTGGDVHGFMLVHSDVQRRFSADEVELARILVNQSAVVMQNAALFSQTRQLTEELEQRVEERTQQLEKEHLRAQSLLRIMRELSASLDLDHVLNRTLKLLNDISGAEQSTILLIRPGEKTFYYRASLGYTDPPPLGGRSTALDVGDGLAGWLVSNRQAVLIENLLDDDRWLGEDNENLNHRSAIGAPLLVGTELLGVMLLFHRQEKHFYADQIEMVQAAANQIAVSINNAELFNLIREQAERLGTMLRTQQIETSRSRAILEAVADGVLVTDSDGKITLFNDSAQHVLGLSRDEVIGKSLEGFSGLFGQAAQMWLNTISKWSSASGVLKSSETYAERITLENDRVVSVHLAPVHLQEEFLGTVSIFRDITHQVEVDRLKSEFVATVSHELRTPMTSIKGYVEVLLMGAAGQMTEQQTQFLQVVLSNTERLNILVNDLLDVSRIEAGKIDLSMQPLRLQDLAIDVVEEQKRRSLESEKAQRYQVAIPADLPRVRGDEERVRQIFTNLLSNASHYTPANGNISVEAKLLNGEVQIDVSDDGIGVLPQDQERIFERFFRGEDPLVLATAGTGLGLSIVQQLIEMHNGRIWLQSSGIPGEGSTFSFTLPIYQEKM